MKIGNQTHKRVTETRCHYRRLVHLRLPTLLVALATSSLCTAGSYILAGFNNGLNSITHPTGYAGAGANLTVGVCIDNTSANAAAMAIPVQNTIDVWNQLQPTTGNLVSDGANNIPPGAFDFESVALHEVGHCIGLGHVNLASESNLAGANRNYTKSTDGVNDGANTPADYNLNAGGDGIRGSADDLRGDDDNLHWFRMANNNPFTIAAIIDSTTYSRNLGNLPAGDTYATNGDRAVAAALGFPNTEAVMQQGTLPDEAQRSLDHDGVATILYGESGLNEVASDGDDYTIALNYIGIVNPANPACDIVIDFDNAQTGFAVCQVQSVFLGGTDHKSITQANIFFNNTVNWFFNDCNCDDPNAIVGTAGADELIGTPGNDIMCGLGGNDRLIGGGGSDCIEGGLGDDRIQGGAEDDFLFGGPGADRLVGDVGNDVIFGGAEDDRIVGNTGDDRIFGDADNDNIVGGPGFDQIDGGPGTDQCVAPPPGGGNDTVVNCQ